MARDEIRPDIRLDKLLWFLRFAKSRSLAQELVIAGHIRRNGTRVERPAQAVRAGDVLVLPLGETARVITILRLPIRRGPAHEAQSHYRVLDETRDNLIAGSPTAAAIKRDLQP